jgi:hypothetical protein
MNRKINGGKTRVTINGIKVPSGPKGSGASNSVSMMLRAVILFQPAATLRTGQRMRGTANAKLTSPKPE